VIFDRASTVAVDVGAIAEEEWQLQISWYTSMLERLRSLKNDIIDRQCRQNMIWYVSELASQKALEAW
jgi:hypothetical protein